MRKALTALLAVGALIAGTVAVAPPASAAIVVELSTAIAADPVQVSPPGALVYYTVSAANAGLVAAPATVTETIANGTLISAPSGCTISGNVATCDVEIPGQSSIELPFVVQSPLTPGSIVNTAEVQLAVPPVPTGVASFAETNHDDNRSQIETAVLAANTEEGSAGYIRPCEPPDPADPTCTLTFKNHKLRVVEAYGAGGGAIAFMNDANIGTGVACGDTQCKSTGLHLDFTDGDPGEDFYALLEGDFSFDSSDPCFGLGSPDCYSLYYRTDSSESFEVVPQCPTTGLPAAGHPCVIKVYKDGTRNFHHVVRLYTSDPEVVETIKSIVNTNN